MKEENKKYNFTLDDIIGRGGFGNVYKALDLTTNEYVALKQIFFNNDEEKSLIINEVNLMESIDSCYSIKLIDKYKKGKYYNLVMELCDDNLYNYVQKNGKVKIEIIQKILVQLNDVLRLMKSKNMNHRDIKPENILIKYINKNDFIIKLSDFGLGKQLNSKKFFTSNVGTGIFKAPEVENKNYNYKADLYSIGIVLYYLYFGEYPIRERKNDYENNEIKDIINNLLEKDCTKRLDWNNYINHPFIINYFNKYLNINIFNDEKYELSEIYYPSKKKYIGQLLKGTNICEGKGILYDEDGNKLYEGDYKNDKCHGKGILYEENGNKFYEGDWKEGKIDGKGIEYYKNGNKRYEGDYKKGNRDGKGILYYENGNKEYEGNYKDDKWEGKGIKFYENGNKEYEGNYKKGKADGKGIKFYENGNKEYEGDWKEGKVDGKGISYYKNGNKLYKGDYKEGKRDGKGISYYKNGNKEYDGDYKEGIVDGKGIKYYENGNKEYERDYKDNKKGSCNII